MQHFTKYIDALAKIGYANQSHREGDFIGEDGLLVCGKCGKPKQVRKALPKPTKEDPNATVTVELPIICLCDQKEMDAEAKLDADRKAEMELKDLRRQSLMGRRFEEAVFSSWKVTPENNQNFNICKNYAETFEDMYREGQNLLFWGGVGTGKSFAAACIANYLMERHVPVIMTSFVQILMEIQRGRDAEEKLVEKLRLVRLLILDDLGAERNTSYALEKVYNIVNERYRSRKPMILTTNLTVDQLSEMSDLDYGRIYDRILENSCPVQFTGTSWRRKNLKQKWAEMEKRLLSRKPDEDGKLPDEGGEGEA